MIGSVWIFSLQARFFIEGGTLDQLLASEDEELPWTQRIHLTLGVARGLDYLHSQGYFHRDLTSKNILIKKDNNLGYNAVIADFGLATKIPDPLSREKLPTVGSPYWMAPEVLTGQFYNERNFGVDYVALSEMIAYCPLDYLQLAFKCCQTEPSKRPRASEVIEWLEKIFRNLQNDIFTRQQKEKSEDNILQASDSEPDTSNEDIIITPLLIGQVMSRDDPTYMPSSTNPFASIQHFQHGRKLLGTSIDYAAELPSPATLYTPPSTPGGGTEKRRCQSLPSSPVLLRRAAEKLHMESLHGSAQYYSQHHTPHTVRARSKSTVFSDAFALKLQAELSRYPQLSPDIPESHLESESPSSPSRCSNAMVAVNGVTRVTGNDVVSNSVSSRTHEPHARGSGLRSTPQWQGPTQTATSRRRGMRRLKYQSLDGDAMGVPPVHSLRNAGQACTVNSNGADSLSVDSESGGLESAGKSPDESGPVQREVSPASIRSSCESFMSIDEHCTSTASSLSSYSEAND
nr:hypothetical protein BaRGS_023282 [Batillaria attramentaria]